MVSDVGWWFQAPSCSLTFKNGHQPQLCISPLPDSCWRAPSFAELFQAMGVLLLQAHLYSILAPSQSPPSCLQQKDREALVQKLLPLED